VGPRCPARGFDYFHFLQIFFAKSRRAVSP
jgi:hypothetical protein